MRYPLPRPKTPPVVSFEKKQSRFISHLFFVSAASDAKAIVQGLRREHPQAAHVVWAFVVGNEGEVFGKSDDGEPAGTGGNPTLAPLLTQRLTGCLIATVRYFGGILLGTGGLTRAYGEGAKRVIEQSTFLPLLPEMQATLSVPYPLYDSVKQQFSRFSVTPLTEHFGETVEVTLQFQARLLKPLQEALASLSRGSLSLRAAMLPSPFDPSPCD